jgi:hypothetical protein
MKQFLILAFSIACLAACKKDKGDSEKPMINVTSPNANQQFTAGQTVNIVATVTDNDELHEVHLFVTNKTTSAEIVHSANHVDVQSFNLNESFVAAAGTTYQIKIEADDHVGNHSEIQFDVKGN